MMVIRVAVHGQSQLLKRSVSAVGGVLHFRQGGHEENDDASDGQRDRPPPGGERASACGVVGVAGSAAQRDMARSRSVELSAARIMVPARPECNPLALTAQVWEDGGSHWLRRRES